MGGNMPKKYLTLDIGGTKVLGAVFEDDKIVCRVKIKTKPQDGGELLESKIIDLILEILIKAEVDIKDISAIAAGAAGIIDEKNGIIIYSPNLPWKNYNIKHSIEEKFNVPFHIGNDVTLGTLGEWKYGIAQNKQNVIGIFVGTGIGGGLIINNKLYTGSKHAAAEIGHMSLNSEGQYCNCGQQGCFEAYSSKIAITRDIKAQIARGRKTILTEFQEIDSAPIRSKALKKAIQKDDALVIEALDRAIYYIAQATGNLINIFDPDMVVMGGGVFEAMGDYIMPIMNKYIGRYAMPNILEGTQIVKSQLGDNAILYGALVLILDHGT
jgi:glucokinase